MHQYVAFLMPCHPDTERNEIRVRRLLTPSSPNANTTVEELNHLLHKSNEVIHFDSEGVFLVIKSRYHRRATGVFSKSDVTTLLKSDQTGGTMEV